MLNLWQWVNVESGFGKNDYEFDPAGKILRKMKIL